MAPIAICRGLSKVYGGGSSAFSALKAIDLELAEKEFLAVTGPSGCGKSTLMHLLGLLDKPSSGHFSLFGHDAQNLDDGERTRLRREKIGFVFQSFNLLMSQTALENVALPMVYSGLRKKEREARGLEILARLGLGGKIKSRPIDLSGGERQRVAIARALANHPRLILADEPTGNLDSASSREVIAILKEINRDGASVVLVTHDPALARQADRIVGLKDGFIVS
ncbi:MAG: ABC transporter ATP-binding protein [Elusimicrobiota bacterium]